MGRAPCCDKSSVKKGPWSPEEDSKLKSYIEQHGTGGNWIALPQKIGLRRCGKSCRLRWLNYLRPNLKHGGFSEEEDNIICSLYINIGSRWSVMAAQLPGRTDNDIKNYWNTRLKKKLLGKQRRDGYQHHTRRGPKQLEPKKEEQNGSLIILNSSGDTAAATGYWPDLTLPSHKQTLIRKLMMKLEAGIPPFVAPDNSHHGPNTSLMAASVQPISPFTGCLPVQAGDFSIELDNMFGGNQVRVEGFDSCYGLPEGMEGEITELLGMPEAVMSWSGVSPLMRPNMGPAAFASYRGSML